MAERYLDKRRELECAFFEYKGKRYFTNPGEIRYNSDFYDYDTKYVRAGAQISAMTDAGPQICDKVRGISAKVADIVGLRHFSRIDFFLSETGEIYFNEINTIPGLTASSLFPLMVRGVAGDLGSLFLDLSRAALTK